jgi:DNA-binding MarR family transcriptional regulator
MTKDKFNPYNHFGFLTNRAGRLIRKHVAPEMKRQGLDMPSSCIGILAELWLQDGLSQKELGLSIIKTKSSINKMLQQMIDAGMIVKKTDEKDRRVSRIFLTEKGKLLKKKIIKISSKMDEDLLTEHSPEEIEIAKKVLTTLYLNLTKITQKIT